MAKKSKPRKKMKLLISSPAKDAPVISGPMTMSGIWLAWCILLILLLLFGIDRNLRAYLDNEIPPAWGIQLLSSWAESLKQHWVWWGAATIASTVVIWCLTWLLFQHFNHEIVLGVCFVLTLVLIILMFRFLFWAQGPTVADFSPSTETSEP